MLDFIFLHACYTNLCPDNYNLYKYICIYIYLYTYLFIYIARYRPINIFIKLHSLYIDTCILIR